MVEEKREEGPMAGEERRGEERRGEEEGIDAAMPKGEDDFHCDRGSDGGRERE